jgi:hypothetical protein
MPEEWRQKIRTGNILHRLGKHVESETDIMTPSQIKAAEILLRKVLPDLKAIELTGADGANITLEVVIAPHGGS